MNLRIDRSVIGGSARVPGSKSHTNRALVAAALADGESVVRDGLIGDDADSMVAGLRALGIDVDVVAPDGASWRVGGRGGVLPSARAVVDANLAGTTLRFLSAVAVLTDGEVTVTGRPPLLARPVGPLVAALRSLGADVSEGPPIVVRRRLRPLGGEVEIDASASSQFVSALLLVAPYFERGLVLRASGLGAGGFVSMTADVMRRRGVHLEVVDAGGGDDDEYRIAGGQVYAAVDEAVPGDASAASHVFTLAAAARGSVVVTNLDGSDAQPDLAVLDVLRAFGALVERRADGTVAVSGPSTSLSPVDVDLVSMPDQLPNVAVLAALAPGRSVIRGVGVTRFHETDRIASLSAELAKMGVVVESPVDGDAGAVAVHGGDVRAPSQPLETYHDHRLAMAFAALGAAVGDVVVAGAECVAKTYRDFWSDAAALGLRYADATS